MKLSWNRKYTTIAVYVALVLLAASFIVFFFLNNNDFGRYVKKLFSAVSPLLYGVIIAYLLNPIVVLFDKKVFVFLDKKTGKRRLRRGLSVAATMMIFLLFISLIISALAPQLIASISELQSKFGGYVATAKKWLAQVGTSSPFLGDIVSALNSYIDKFLDKTEEIVTVVMPWLGSFATSLLNALKNALIGIVFAIFILCGKERIGAVTNKLLRAYLSDNRRTGLISAVKKADKSFGGYIKGTILDAIFVGIVNFIFLGLIGAPFYPLISVVLGITNMVPIFGPWMGSIPCALILLIASPSKVIPFILFTIVFQGIDGNVIAPKLIGSNTGMPSEWVVIAITVMSGFFGAAGMIIGVPTFAVAYTLICDKINAKLAKKGYSSDDVDYCEGRAKEIMLEAAEEEARPKEKKLLGFIRKRRKKPDTKDNAVTDGSENIPNAGAKNPPTDDKQ